MKKVPKIKNKIKTKLLILKNSCYKLRANYQLPLYLCKLIYDLDGSESVDYVKYLMEMSQHLLRVSQYYKKFRFAEKESEQVIKNGLKKLGYVVDVNA